MLASVGRGLRSLVFGCGGANQGIVSNGAAVFNLRWVTVI